ncbi:MAG: hypothetical protein LBP41_00025 [Holosporaceae bacterium]|jgi:hypothetical protein|nr:hypothetical protein [Holosporaceae bacterium]
MPKGMDIMNTNTGAYEEVKQGNSITSVSCTIETSEPDDIFSSEIKDREGSSPCDEATAGCKRLTNDSVAAGEMPNFGDVINYDVEVEMDFGSWGPMIQSYLYDGTTIKKIIIRRVMNINNELVDIQTTTYESCLFKSYKQVGKRITFSFSWENKEDINVARARDGKKIGQYGVSYDSATGVATRDVS